MAIDGSLHKAPCGGEGTGPNPTDRGKLGWKWSIATDANGIPIGWAIDGANRNDVKLLGPTLDDVDRDDLLRDIETVHLDRGYDYPRIRRQLNDAGLRQGEAFGLTVPCLDLDAEARLRPPDLRKSISTGRQIHVTQQLILVTGRAPDLGDPKTDARVRVVPIPKFLVDELTSHLADFGVGESGLVFSDDHGRSLRRNRFSEKVWRPAVVAAKARNGAHFHDLRHYYASLLIGSGASVKTVQNRLGRESATETLDTYGHLWPNSEEHTREAVERELAGLGLRESEDSVRTVASDLG